MDVVKTNNRPCVNDLVKLSSSKRNRTQDRLKALQTQAQEDDDWDGESRTMQFEMNYNDKKAAVKQLKSVQSSSRRSELQSKLLDKLEKASQGTRSEMSHFSRVSGASKPQSIRSGLKSQQGSIYSRKA